MIKAKLLQRGESLSSFFPKIVFNPEEISDARVVYSSAEISSKGPEYTHIMDPLKPGWGTSERLIYSQAADFPAFLFEWGKVSGSGEVSTDDMYWSTLSGSKGNGDNKYDGEISGFDVIHLAGDYTDIFIPSPSGKIYTAIFRGILEEPGEVLLS